MPNQAEIALAKPVAHKLPNLSLKNRATSATRRREALTAKIASINGIAQEFVNLSKHVDHLPLTRKLVLHDENVHGSILRGVCPLISKQTGVNSDIITRWGMEFHSANDAEVF